MRSKLMLSVLATLGLLNGCAYWQTTDKTPLTPQGELNVCIRDEVRAYKQNGRLQNLGESAAAQKIAGYCTDKTKLFAMYNQAVDNAKNMMKEHSRGTSLRRW